MSIRFGEETIKSEWPQTVRLHGVFVTVGQYGIRHIEAGITKRENGVWRLLWEVHYGNGIPSLSTMGDVLAIRIAVRRHIDNVRV